MSSNSVETTTSKKDKSIVGVNEVDSKHSVVVDDIAAKYVDENLTYTKAEVKKIVRKIDFHIIIWLLLNVLLAAADKVSNGTASIYGLQTDLNLHGDEYSWIGSAFYFGYLFWSFPAGVILQKLPIAKLAGGCFVVWGLFIIGSGFSENFETMIAIRVILGILEAPIVPINLIIVASWYSRNNTISGTSDEHEGEGEEKKKVRSGSEQSLRIGLFYTGFSVLITGPLGYAVGGIDDTTHKPWRYFLWILGALSVAYGILEILFLPDSPVNAKFLTEREKAIVIDRVRKNQVGVKNTKFKWEQFFQTLKDPKVWVMTLIQLFISIPNGGLTNFSHLIVTGLGWIDEDALWPNRRTTVLTMPTGLFQTLSVYMSSGILFLLEKYYPKKHFKGILLCLFLIPAFVGTGCLYKLPLHWYNSRLISLYFSFFYLGPYILSLNLIASNHAGFTRRITANSIYFTAYAVSNLIAPQFFLESQEPTYTLGVAAIFAAYALTIAASFLYMFLCWRENRRRDKLYGPAVVENRDTDLQDLTDIDNVNFRYKW